MKILTPRNYYKPFEYPWAYDLWMLHEAQHWLAREVPLHEDVRDWNERLTDSEKSLLTHLFRFFTQADVDVQGGYSNHFLPYFSHKPEVAMMLSSFNAREAIHMDAYALLIETVGMPDETYQQFHEYKEMKAKHDFITDFNMEEPEEVLKSLAVYSAFTEGMQLFGSFVVLLNFSRHNKMKNMGNIIAWSVRDESMHVEGMTQLFKEYHQEWAISTNDGVKEALLREKIKDIAKEMVNLEDHFIDLIFSDSTAIEGLTPDEVKDYIRYISNTRWIQLGFDGLLFESHVDNPLPWVEEMINAEEHTNFFEAKSTFYSKAMTEGSMEEIQWT